MHGRMHGGSFGRGAGCWRSAFILMIINRFCGLALPAASKPFVDGVLSKHQGGMLLPIIAFVLTATLTQASYLIRTDATALQGGAAHDRRPAPPGTVAHWPALGQLL